MASPGDEQDGEIAPKDITINSSLEDLQTDEQRSILDTISKVRKCGLDKMLSLPQIVVCGDQSAGKSSVLEALTEIPFPRNDNLCTRFATEISLRREPVTSLTIRVIPDSLRPQNEQEAIKAFSESITDLDALPAIMDSAMKVMGISPTQSPDSASAFAKDVLSIEIQGPDRPQLTLVDIPGLIHSSTKGVSDADVAIVAEITNSYIAQPRTICLAVVAASHDAANQTILQLVRKFDPKGERTLGVITKPDKLSPGSGSEAKFLELAQNDDVFFKLGWHVVKNRKFEEAKFSIVERNSAEKVFFSTSNFKDLPPENLGIDMLRVKLSQLLFEHVKKELPRLHEDLENSLQTAKDELHSLGQSRATAAECRLFLAHLNMDCHEICKAALKGNYDIDYFKADAGLDDKFSLDNNSTIARLRATIQYVNTVFADEFRKKGHMYQIQLNETESETESGSEIDSEMVENESETSAVKTTVTKPEVLSKKDALKWVRKELLRSRGTELVGNFNPYLIAALFWKQSSPWEKLAKAHIQQVSKLCENFLRHLLDQVAPQDLKPRIWSALVQDTLKRRREAALSELDKLVTDRNDSPINYNHYYTDNIYKKRHARIEAQIQRHVPEDSQGAGQRCSVGNHYFRVDVHQELTKTIQRWTKGGTPDMEKFSCEEALDCLLAIYKVQEKTFIANVATQVIERHIVRGLDSIFSPLVAVNMPDTKVQSIVSEPSGTVRQRLFLTDRVRQLEEGQQIFREVLET